MPQFQTQNVFQDALMSKVFKQFVINLNNSITIEYSPNARVQPATKTSSDGKSSSDGAFIIKGVKSGEEFQTLVVTAMQSSFDSFASVAKEDSKALLQAQVDKISKVVKDKTFLGLAVSKFDPENIPGKDPVALPWVAPYGDNPFEVMQVYFEEKQQVVAFQPENASTLFATLLDYEVQRAQAAPNGKATRVILCSPQHAFEFTPNLPQFKEALEGVKSAGSIGAYMAKYQQAASEAWSSAKLDSATKTQIVQWVAANLLPVKDISVAFLDDVMSIDRTAGLKKFHEQLVLRLKPYLASLEKADQANVIRSLDRYMLQNALPESVSKLVVPFANTNWDMEGTNGEKIENPILRFCIYPDPIAQKVYFGLIDNKGKNLMAMDQDDWVNNQPWEISLTTV